MLSSYNENVIESGLKIMRQRTSITNKSPLNPLFNYRIKTDIKETGGSPYSIPFNFQVLSYKYPDIKDKKKGEEASKEAIKEYLLPDGNTIMKIEPGSTENRIYDALE